ncbi:SRPBCC family protein [Lutimonas saemankumensis]|uniref:SRPBCC family protein n=1 Tax=Lutimonas saemankumensis TaxID=483016 RepID=UPI001CD4C922|nr:SRPBCC family protein [Lutimonas saemankumensis]MCA0931278.1 SRPBCC family protein [Lutimonas saemankumensis]
MTEVIVNKSINVSADSAWETLSSFRGIENYSPVERSVTEGTGAGAKRTCFMPDGAAIHEVLNFANDGEKEMQYKITEGPFPVTGYVSDIKITPTGSSSCEIQWSCEFQSSEEVKEQMKDLFGGFYNVIIDSLEGHLNN